MTLPDAAAVAAADYAQSCWVNDAAQTGMSFAAAVAAAAAVA